jgi:hypothetical protein
MFCRRASARSKAQTPPLRFSKQFQKVHSRKFRSGGCSQKLGKERYFYWRPASYVLALFPSS